MDKGHLDNLSKGESVVLPVWAWRLSPTQSSMGVTVSLTVCNEQKFDVTSQLCNRQSSHMIHEFTKCDFPYVREVTLCNLVITITVYGNRA